MTYIILKGTSGFATSVQSHCKGPYVYVQSHRYTYGNDLNTVANVDVSDSCCRYIGKIIARDLRHLANQLYRTTVTWPGSHATVTRTNLEIIYLLTCNTPGRIRTYIERCAISIPMQPMPNSHRAMFTEYSKCFDIFAVL